MGGRFCRLRVVRCDALRLSNHRGGRSERVPGSRVARAERWRSVAAASAVVERREASAPQRRAPHREMRRLRNSVFRRSAFLFVYPRVILTPPVPPPAPSDEGHAPPSVRLLRRRHSSGAKARRENDFAHPPPHVSAGEGDHPKGGGGGMRRFRKIAGTYSRRGPCPFHHPAAQGGPPSPLRGAG